MIPIPILDGVFQLGGKLLDRLWPDPAQKAAAVLELEKMRQTGELAQLAADTDLARAQVAVNLEEAKHASLFIAGWRPAVGWVCASAFAYSYVVLPFLQFVVLTFGTQGMADGLVNLPKLELGDMMPVLLGMLGLAAARTVEKVKDVEGNR
tara:strand:+ start:132 stop:584 length:453 start_codon:yes stop_codon:yes gene_type:complete